MKKSQYEVYVAISPNDKYYAIDYEWIPEGTEDVISETDCISEAKKFSEIKDILDYENEVIDDDDFMIKGEFKPKLYKQIKVTTTFELVKEIHVF